jgi:hypothetical protein
MIYVILAILLASYTFGITVTWIYARNNKLTMNEAMVEMYYNAHPREKGRRDIEILLRESLISSLTLVNKTTT